MSDTQEGWGFPGSSRKAHYFVDTRSLCGRWGLYMGRLDTSDKPSPDDCAECRRRLAKRQAA